MTDRLPHPPVPDFASPDFDRLLASLTAEFAATAEHHDRTREFPAANFARLHELGLLALTAPVADGGLGAGLDTAYRVVHAVARGEPSTALILVMQFLHLAFHDRLARWPEHLRRRVIGDVVRDGALVNSLRVEPELGTPARGGLPGTVARRVDGGWIINGRKLYSTGSPGLTWNFVWARSDDAVPLVGAWLVHRDTPGVRVIETWDHLGLRASGSHDVVFTDVFVPADHAVDVAPIDQAAAPDARFSAWIGVLLSAVYDGVARAARDWFAEWARTRVPASLGAPLSSLQRYQQALGEIDGLLFSNRVLLESGVRGGLAPAEYSLIKTLVTNQAIAAVQKAVELSSNPGLHRANPLERHFRDVLCGRIHTPQDDAVYGQLGIAAFAAAAALAAEGGPLVPKVAGRAPEGAVIAPPTAVADAAR
ncbi:acyl-CoA dehydrogenase family protein [Derxia gummosa]|uniref:Acyl-CoA dehydrogenase family protein n=1 Tax=Derxia gummosa DSM 723 TaxID=1121388 RepID=A0A8B6XAY2_9BURK|nr:acyl-CoA dehydrogenase family protein [Derxia gummosa]